MNDYAIIGDDVLLEVHNGTRYVNWLCAKGCEINISTEQILKTTVGNGLGIKRAVRRIEWAVSYSGVTYITSTAASGIYSFDLLDIDRIVNGYLIKIHFVDPKGNAKVLSGRVFLNSATITGNVKTFSDSTFDMQGDGIYEITDEVAESPDSGESPDAGESPDTGDSPGTGIPEIATATAFTEDTTDITFTEPVVVTEDGWSFEKIVLGTPTPRTITSLTGSGTDWQFTFSDAAFSFTSLNLTYDSATGNTLDLTGNELEDITITGYTNLIP